jgi:hypothetical protein
MKSKTDKCQWYRVPAHTGWLIGAASPQEAAELMWKGAAVEVVEEQRPRAM